MITFVDLKLILSHTWGLEVTLIALNKLNSTGKKQINELKRKVTRDFVRNMLNFKEIIHALHVVLFI